jgi:hypothetical protein
MSGQCYNPSHFISGEGAPCTNQMGGWVDPTAVLEDVEWSQISCPAGNRNPAAQPIACCYTNRAIVAVNSNTNKNNLFTVFKYNVSSSSYITEQYNE